VNRRTGSLICSSCAYVSPTMLGGSPLASMLQSAIHICERLHDSAFQDGTTSGIVTSTPTCQMQISCSFRSACAKLMIAATILRGAHLA
jgi:hypothetical protein